MKYTNELMESFRKEFEENSWRHPKDFDLKIPGEVRVQWETLKHKKEEK